MYSPPASLRSASPSLLKQRGGKIHIIRYLSTVFVGKSPPLCISKVKGAFLSPPSLPQQGGGWFFTPFFASAEKGDGGMSTCIYLPELLTKAMLLLSGDQEGTLIVPCPP